MWQWLKIKNMFTLHFYRFLKSNQFLCMMIFKIFHEIVVFLDQSKYYKIFFTSSIHFVCSSSATRSLVRYVVSKHLLHFLALSLVGLISFGSCCYGSPSISSIRSFRVIEVGAERDELPRSSTVLLNSIQFS